MKIATQHYQDSVITPYGNNHWNGKEKIDISKEKDDAVILEISAKGKRAIQLKEKNEFEQDIVMFLQLLLKVIQECMMLTRRYRLLLKIVAKRNRDLYMILSAKIFLLEMAAL